MASPSPCGARGPPLADCCGAPLLAPSVWWTTLGENLTKQPKLRVVESAHKSQRTTVAQAQNAPSTTVRRARQYSAISSGRSCGQCSRNMA